MAVTRAESAVLHAAIRWHGARAMLDEAEFAPAGHEGAAEVPALRAKVDAEAAILRAKVAAYLWGRR